jgi:hypothetical protein
MIVCYSADHADMELRIYVRGFVYSAIILTAGFIPMTALGAGRQATPAKAPRTLAEVPATTPSCGFEWNSADGLSCNGTPTNLLTNRCGEDGVTMNTYFFPVDMQNGSDANDLGGGCYKKVLQNANAVINCDQLCGGTCKRDADFCKGPISPFYPNLNAFGIASYFDSAHCDCPPKPIQECMCPSVPGVYTIDGQQVVVSVLDLCWMGAMLPQCPDASCIVTTTHADGTSETEPQACTTVFPFAPPPPGMGAAGSTLPGGAPTTSASSGAVTPAPMPLAAQRL